MGSSARLDVSGFGEKGNLLPLPGLLHKQVRKCRRRVAIVARLVYCSV